MNKQRKILEFAKSVLVIVLACNAINLSGKILFPEGVYSLLQQEKAEESGMVQQQERSVVAWPVRIVISSFRGEEVRRYGVQYDRESCEREFEPIAGLLRESLSEAAALAEVSRTEWEQALGMYSNIYFDLLGEVPLPVLTGWLAGSDSRLSGSARRLVLTAEEERVKLYYQNQENGRYYVCSSEMVQAEQLLNITDLILDNGVEFAFEMDAYETLAGDTMLLPEVPSPRIYTAENPLRVEGQSPEYRSNGVLGQLLTALSFPDNSYIYPGTDQVIRSGTDTLRISSQGVVRYAAGEEDSRYPIVSQGELPTQFEVAEACRSLAEGALGSQAGAARLYLQSMKQTDTGWELYFGYCLDGARVQVGELGYAACFQVERDEITQFSLQMRKYTDTDSRSVILPERQAMAAMQALEAEERELVLIYQDIGGDMVSAGWIAE